MEVVSIVNVTKLYKIANLRATLALTLEAGVGTDGEAAEGAAAETHDCSAG